MASVEKRLQDGEVTWLARWRDPEGKQRKRSFARRIDADRFLTSVTADMLRGQYVDPSDRTTVSGYACRWVALRPHTRERTESMIRNHIDGTTLGRRRLAGLLPSEAQAWVSERATVLAPSTLRAVVKLLRVIYTAAVLDRLVTVSPVTRLSLPSARGERVVPLTIEQVRDLAHAIGPTYRAMIYTQAGLGAPDRRVVGAARAGLRLPPSHGAHRVAGRATPSDARPAEDASFASDAPAARDGRDTLADHLQRFPVGESGLIFRIRTDRPHAREHEGSRVFGTAVRRAGLPEGKSTHDLRHHYASVLLYAGESVVAVAERLSHESAALVLSTFGHLMPDSEDRARRALDDAWRAPLVPREEAEGV